MSAAVLSALELARLMGVTVQAVRRAANEGNWPYQEARIRGGRRRLYRLADLPAKYGAAYADRAVPAPAESPPVPASSPPPVDTAGLKNWQRARMEARAAVICRLEAWTAEFAISRNKAIDRLIEQVKTEALADDLRNLVAAANGKSGGRLKLSRATVYNWFKAHDERGPAGLASKARRAGPVIPAWADQFMTLYGDPRKPSLAAIVEQLPDRLPDGVEAPSYQAAARFLKTLTAVTRHRGRMGPRALKSLQAYVKRDASELWPGAVYAADGHTFKAEVQHPVHGGPFRPEITPVIDVYTRRIVGWSAGLAESTWTVLDAARHSFANSSLPDIWYTDNGSGFRNEIMEAPLTGFMARWRVTFRNSLPYNSQARGVIERWHQTLAKAAKELPTYLGKDMDPEAKQRAFKVTRADIKRVGASRLLMEWPDFLGFIQDTVDAYNARPHRGLPRIRDEITMRRRHMTPDEVWEKAVAEGWEPDPVSAAEADDMFRPYEIRKAARGLVSLFGNEYFGGGALEAFHGEEVMVGYDIHDASRVWVRELVKTADRIGQGRLICVAEWGGNRRSYFPVSVAEQARDKRRAGRLRRLEARRDEIEAERRPNPLIEVGADEPLSEAESALADEMFERIDKPLEAAPAETTVNGRPVFHNDLDFAAWAAANPSMITAHDRDYLAERLTSEPFRQLLEMEGVDISQLTDLARKQGAA